MPKYHFYYDESEHSRKINYKTITADNYYDNFIVTIVGFPNNREKEIYQKYAAFEEKYQERKSNDELKSQTLKQKEFTNGFASMNINNVQFIDDLLAIFDNDFVIYFAVINKLEFILNQIFKDYRNSLNCDMDEIRYTIVKSITLYQPKEILNTIFENTKELITALKKFYNEKITYNKSNLKLKNAENKAFKEVLLVLNDDKEIKQIDWNYNIPFYGFKQYLKELSIDNYDLTIDKEGNDSKTLKAACKEGLINVSEKDSKDVIGIRLADMLAGILSKLLKAINNELRYKTPDEQIQKKILGKGWFNLRQDQLNLYKKLYILLCKKHDWYKFFAGMYSDDLITIISLLNYMDQFETINDIGDNAMHGEYFNSYLCVNLRKHFEKMKNKLTIEFDPCENKEFFINQRGAKIFYDITKQPLLKITKANKYKVLSVGITKNGIPLITIEEKSKEIKCYRLPNDYLNWVLSSVEFSNYGVNPFPAEVVFSKENGEYYADIL